MIDWDDERWRGHRLARQIMGMVAVLHERGFESLYLH